MISTGLEAYFGKLGLLVATVSMSGILFGTAGAFADVPETSDPIKIVVNNWSSQLVLANISGRLLERMGYAVEYEPSHTQLQYAAIGSGVMHLQVEVWEGTMAVAFGSQIDRGRMVDAGDHAAATREDWWYPNHVAELCPGLPDWSALNRCADVLATPETAPKARYLAGPADWEKPDQERVQALGLDVVVVNAKNASQLTTELAAAVVNKAPIILFNWTPNWVEAKYPGAFVEFPEHDPECESDPSWGDNPDAPYDCGNPRNGWLKKGVWSGFENKWPCAFGLIKSMSFSNEQISHAAAKVDVEGLTPEQAAERWIEENASVWESWIPACAP